MDFVSSTSHLQMLYLAQGEHRVSEVGDTEVDTKEERA